MSDDESGAEASGTLRGRSGSTGTFPTGEEILLKLGDHLKAKGIKLQCPICGFKGFGVEGIVIHVFSKNLEALTLEGPALPTVPVTCKNCGLVLQFSAVEIGLT